MTDLELDAPARRRLSRYRRAVRGGTNQTLHAIRRKMAELEHEIRDFLADPAHRGPMAVLYDPDERRLLRADLAAAAYQLMTIGAPVESQLIPLRRGDPPVTDIAPAALNGASSV